MESNIGDYDGVSNFNSDDDRLKPSTEEGRGELHDGVSDDEPSKWLIMRMTTEQKILILILSLASLTSWGSIAIVSPLLPKQTESKGISTALTGWIFAANGISSFFSSPFFGKLISIVGFKGMIVGGLIFEGSCNVLFGVMSLYPVTDEDSRLTYLLLMIIVRFFASSGHAAFCTANFALTAKCFDEDAVSIIGFGETTSGLGLVFGPALGGFLFEMGGFYLPFTLFGVVTILMGCLAVLLVPAEHPEIQKDEIKVPLFSLLINPTGITASLCIVSAAGIWAATEPILEPHLRVFGLTPSVLGFVFCLINASYMLVTPMVGTLTKWLGGNTVTVLGYLLCGCSTLFLGPSPALGFGDNYQELWMDILSLITLGLGIAFALVPTFDVYFNLVEEQGFKNDDKTYGVISGMWFSVYAIGDTIGPSVSGILSDDIGTPWTWTLLSALSAVMVVLVSITAAYQRYTKGRKSGGGEDLEAKKQIQEDEGTYDEQNDMPAEKTPLLNNN